MRIRLGIVDDHPSLLLGLEVLFAPIRDIQVVATAPTVRELLRIDDLLTLVLLDLSLGDGSTPTGNLRTLQQAGVPALVFSAADQPALVREASRFGALGMVCKSAPQEEVLSAVRQAARGQIVFSSDWAAALEDDDGFVEQLLTKREAEVLSLYASGETAANIATLLFISRETVQDHVRRIRAKYASAGRPAKTKIDLYHRAVEDGILGKRA